MCRMRRKYLNDLKKLRFEQIEHVQIFINTIYFYYKDEKYFDYWLFPWEAWALKMVDCEDFANTIIDIVKRKLNIKMDLIVLRRFKDGKWEGHAACYYGGTIYDSTDIKRIKLGEPGWEKVYICPHWLIPAHIVWKRFWYYWSKGVSYAIGKCKALLAKRKRAQ